MDFSPIELDDATRAFWDDARAFCDEHVTPEVIDEEFRTGSGFNEGLHKALAARGWIVPTWPSDAGGAGATFLQAALLNRELRDRHAPTITRGTTMMVLPAVEQWGADELKADVLPGVARGDVRFCLGYTEPDSGSDIAAARTRAHRDGDEWVIEGQKMFTTGAQNCQYSFLLTRTNPDAPKHKGLTMFLCPLAEAEIRPIHTLGGERTNMVFYDSIRVADSYRLGPVDQGWMVLLGPLNSEHALGEDATRVTLEEPGGMYGSSSATSLGVALEWARTPGPDGRRPIDDPLVRHRLAQAALEVEVATTSTGPGVGSSPPRWPSASTRTLSTWSVPVDCSPPARRAPLVEAGWSTPTASPRAPPPTAARPRSSATSWPNGSSAFPAARRPLPSRWSDDGEPVTTDERRGRYLLLSAPASTGMTVPVT